MHICTDGGVAGEGRAALLFCCMREQLNFPSLTSQALNQNDFDKRRAQGAKFLKMARVYQGGG